MAADWAVWSPSHALRARDSAVAMCVQRECEADVAKAADGKTCRDLDRCGGASCRDVLDMCVQVKCPDKGRG